MQSFNDLVYALTSGEGEESASSHDDDDSGVGTEDFFNEKGFSGNLLGVYAASAQVGDTSDVTSIQSLGEHMPPAEVVTLLSDTLSQNMESLLCTDFGPLGRLTLSRDTPESVTASQPHQCPVAARRGMHQKTALNATRSTSHTSLPSTREPGCLTFSTPLLPVRVIRLR